MLNETATKYDTSSTFIKRKLNVKKNDKVDFVLPNIRPCSNKHNSLRETKK